MFTASFAVPSSFSLGSRELRAAYLRDLLLAWIKPSGLKVGSGLSARSSTRSETSLSAKMRFARNSRHVVASFSSGQELQSPQP